MRKRSNRREGKKIMKINAINSHSITCKGDDRIRYQIRSHTCTRYLCNAAQKIKQKQKNNKSRSVYFPERLCRSFSRSMLERHATGTLVVGLSLLSCFFSFSFFFFHVSFVVRALCSPIPRLYNTIVSRKVLLGREKEMNMM